MKALIVDDEPFPAKHLKELLEQYCFEITEIDMLFSPLEAIEKLKHKHYDILFLDVEMPKVNGMELAKKVKHSSNTQIIFTTAYSTYAVDAFQANAAHYIVKPVDEEELVLAVRKAQMQISKRSASDKNKEGKISIFKDNEYLIVSQNDIVRIEGDGGYTKIVIENNEHLSSKRMGHYAEVLDEKQFMRCHNSHIINIDKVSKVNKADGYVTLINGDIIPVSSTKRNHLYERIIKS